MNLYQKAGEGRLSKTKGGIVPPGAAPAVPVFTGRDLLSAFAVVLMWGLNFIAMKLVLRDFSAMQLGAMRYFFAAVPWLFFVRFPHGALRWVVAYGMLQCFGQFGLLFIALQVGMTAALASVLMQTQVFFTALFSYLFLREKLNMSLRLGLLCAMLGLACFVIDLFTQDTLTGITALGFSLCLAAASLWGVANIAAKRIQRTVAHFEPFGFTVWSCLVSVIPFALSALLFDPEPRGWRWHALGWQHLLAVIYLGWFATTLAYALWMRLLMRHSANRVAPFSLGVPVIGLSTGILVLGEAVSLWQWSGVVFIVLALGIVLLWPRLAGKRNTGNTRNIGDTAKKTA